MEALPLKSLSAIGGVTLSEPAYPLESLSIAFFPSNFHRPDPCARRSFNWSTRGMGLRRRGGRLSAKRPIGRTGAWGVRRAGFRKSWVAIMVVSRCPKAVGAGPGLPGDDGVAGRGFGRVGSEAASRRLAISTVPFDAVGDLVAERLTGEAVCAWVLAGPAPKSIRESS